MDILSDKIVTTRKKHRCDACCRLFSKGTKMRTQVNTYDGIGTWRECPTCAELLSKHSDYFGDDTYPRMFESGCVIDSLNEGETPESKLEHLNTTPNPKT